MSPNKALLLFLIWLVPRTSHSMQRSLLVLAASTAVYAYAPAPDESERGSLTHFISLVASDAFSAHAHAANSPTVQAASAAHESGPPAHVAHVAVRSAVVFFSGVVESVPSYMIACVMVLAVVAVFALCWCVRVPLYSPFISLSLHPKHTHALEQLPTAIARPATHGL